MTNKKSKSNASSTASTSNMESSKAKLERLLAVREGRRRYVSKMGSRGNRNIAFSFGSKRLRAARCYTITSGGGTNVLNRNRSRNPVFMRSRSDR